MHLYNLTLTLSNNTCETFERLSFHLLQRLIESAYDDSNVTDIAVDILAP
jgi:hypothetical protein